jgi:hypothetical protein
VVNMLIKATVNSEVGEGRREVVNGTIELGP